MRHKSGKCQGILKHCQGNFHWVVYTMSLKAKAVSNFFVFI